MGRSRARFKGVAIRGGEKARQAAGGERQAPGAFRNRLRPVRPAAYRHVRGGGAHLHGPPRLPRPDRGQGPGAPPLLLRRHGRAPQSAGQRAEPGAPAALYRPAAYRGAGPLRRRFSFLRRRQQCAASRLPRPLRLRLRIRQRHRIYRSGRFDATLLRMLAAYDEVKEIILPTLGPERRATYSPFLPISPRTGVVLQVPTVARDVNAGTITYIDPETGGEMTTPVTGGRVKCQWKADWALRWVALGVDYEMAGKDLIDSVTLASKICRALGATPPDGFIYELFLDETGQKISKSKGNGLSIDDWLAYASPESLSLFMFQKPKAAKRLYFDVIPRAADEYYQFLDAYFRQDVSNRLANPVWHIHSGHPPEERLPVPFSMLLNLASASNTEDADILWGFVTRHRPEVTRESSPALDRLVHYAVRYYHDFVKPKKRFRAADPVERQALTALDATLAALPADADAESIQTAIYDVGRSFERYQARDKPGPDGRPGVSLGFFSTLYELLLGQERGPRFGSFVAIYGVAETRGLIASALSGALSSPAAAASG